MINKLKKNKTMIILFDEESRSFSAVEETREFNDNTKMNVLKRLGGHISKHRTSYATGGGAIAGGVTGALVARKRARKAGLERGTKEYRRAITKGALAGTGIGAVAGYGAERIGTNIGTYHKTKKQLMRDEGIKDRKDFMNMHGATRKSMRKYIVDKANFGKRYGRW